MKTIGDLWEQNAVSIAEEHLATEISYRVAARLFWMSMNVSARSRERIVMAAVPGEHHVLGLRLAADVLESAGFDVLFLGPDLPIDALLRSCRTHRPDLVGLSVTMPQNLPTLASAIDEINKLERPPRVIVGGRLAEQAVADGVPAAYVRRSDELLEAVERLLASDRVASNA